MAKKKKTEDVEVEPMVEAVVEPIAPEGDGVAVTEPVSVEPTPEPLEPGEVIREDREQSIRIDGEVFHHVRNALDGRWIYAPLRPRG